MIRRLIVSTALIAGFLVGCSALNRPTTESHIPTGTTPYVPSTDRTVTSAILSRPLPIASVDPTAAEGSRIQTRTSSASGVFVIAHSLSTRMKAREILMNSRLHEANLRQSDGALVVCRSELFNPLNYSYGSVGELNEDADRQLNISGSNYHVYIYSFDEDFQCHQVKHTSFPADD